MTCHEKYTKFNIIVNRELFFYDDIDWGESGNGPIAYATVQLTNMKPGTYKCVVKHEDVPKWGCRNSHLVVYHSKLRKRDLKTLPFEDIGQLTIDSWLLCCITYLKI